MIIDRCGKTAGYVTDTAISGCRNMIGVLSDRLDTIVAGPTVADYTGMIENRSGETGRAMTCTAIRAGDDMRRRLRKSTDCIVSAIVARDTITADTGMRECRWIERRRGVAIFAVLGRWHMQQGRTLAHGELTVVTALAATADAGMDKTEESRRGKTALIDVDVTQAAIILSRNMILSLADRDVSIMASGAVAAVYTDMIEADAGKGIEQVRAVT